MMSNTNTLFYLFMIKDTKFTNTINESVKPISKILIEGKAYDLLISNRGISFRKKLAERLDSIFDLKVGWKTWKSRFLYPNENIPAKNAEKISTAMTEMLMWALQEQIDYLQNEMKETEKLIKSSIEIINNYKNEKEEIL